MLAANEFLKSIVNNSMDAIVSYDQDFQFTSWNPGAEEMFGYNDDEIIGKPSVLLVDEKASSALKGLFKEVKEKGLGISELVCITKSGEHLSVLQTVSRIVSVDGQCLGYSSIIRDMTIEKKARGVLANRINNRYTRRLEYRLRRLDPDALRLTDKERSVLLLLTRDLAISDRSIAGKLRINRTTVSAIRGRLSRDGWFAGTAVANPIVFGYELMTVVYGEWFSIDKARLKQAQDAISSLPNTAAFFSTGSFFTSLMFFRNAIEEKKTVSAFERKLSMLTPGTETMLKHYTNPLGCISFRKLFDCSGLVREIFDARADEPEPGPEFCTRKIDLKKNARRVIAEIMNHPSSTVREISQRTDVSQPTASKIRNQALSSGMMRIIGALNPRKFPNGVTVFAHLRIRPGNESFISSIHTKPYIVFDARTDREWFIIAQFRDFQDQVDRFATFIDKYRKLNIFLRDPRIIIMRAADLASGTKIDFSGINF